MTVETRPQIDLTEQLARAAVAAIADTAPTIQADPKAVRYLTVEIELIGGRPAEARAWVERTCNLGRLLEDRRRT